LKFARNVLHGLAYPRTRLQVDFFTDTSYSALAKKICVFFPSYFLGEIEIAPDHIYTPLRIAAIVEQARGSIPLSPRTSGPRNSFNLGALV
jgi:hypothetical protein